MRSGWSLGIVMIVLAGISVSPGGPRPPLSPLAWSQVALLLGGGVLMFLAPAVGAWVGLAAAVTTVGGGVAAWAGHASWGLPAPPALSIGVGLYLCLRLAMARRVAARPPRDDS